MNRKYLYIYTLLLASSLISVPLWCRMPLMLSQKHINQVKQQLNYEESRLAKVQATAFVAATGAGVGGLSYLGYKWLKTSPTEEPAQQLAGQTQAQSNQQQPNQQAAPPTSQNQNQNQNRTGVRAWLLNQALDVWKFGGHFVKYETAYALYSAVRDKINNIYADRTLPWFLQRRTVWHTALDNFKQEVVNYNPQDQEAKDELESACRCLLAELESIIGFMQHTTERAQTQLKSQPQIVHVSKVYLTRLRMSSEKVKVIAMRFIEHVTLLLDYDQDYEQKRSMHNTVMGSLIDDLTKELTLFKQFEQKVKILSSGAAA